MPGNVIGIVFLTSTEMGLAEPAEVPSRKTHGQKRHTSAVWEWGWKATLQWKPSSGSHSKKAL